MNYPFTTGRVITVVAALAGTALLLGAFLLYEQLLHVMFAHPPHSLTAHAVFLSLITAAVMWLSFWISGRMHRQTLEGVREVLTQAGVGISMMDRHGRILWYNPALARLFGEEGRSWVGHPVLEHYREHQADQAISALQKDLARVAAGQVSHNEFEITRSDGRPIALSYALSPLRGPHGNVLGALGVFVDITEHRRMAEELRASRDNLCRLLEAIPAGVTVVDATTGRPVLWNHAALHMLGSPEAREATGDEQQRFFFPAIRRVFDAQGNELSPAETLLARTLQTRLPFSHQHNVIELEDGRRLDVAASTAFLETPEGGQGVLIFQDISGIQQLHRELMVQRVQAERLEALLTTVATLNHEINNPLTGIFGSADLILMRPNLDPTVRRYTEKIFDLARRISELVRGLSTATQFERRAEKGFEEYVKVKPSAG